MRINNETKTGILVLMCLGILGALLVKVGNFTLTKKGYTVRSEFGFIAGVRKHAPVRLAGVDVGEVRNIRLVYGDRTRIELDLWFEEGVKVRKDAKATVTTLGLMGEKYIELQPGSSAVAYAAEGDTILGEDPVRLEELIEIGKRVAGDISKMAGDISRVATHVDETIVENKPRIKNIFVNLDETSVNFKDFSQDIKYHPWKILAKGKEKTREEMDREDAQRRAAAAEAVTAPAPSTGPRSNFTAAKR